MSIENVLFRCGGGGNSKLKVASLTVTTQPTKLNYVQYEKLNLAGIQVMATFEDGVTANVTSAITTTPSITDLLSAVGTNTITVEWGGAKTTFNVTVQELVSISVTHAPNKIYYEPDDTLDLTGLVITGTSASLTGELTSSCVYNPAEGTILSEEGTVTVTATVGAFTTSFNVSVTSAETLYQQVKAMTTDIPEDLWLTFVNSGCIAMVIAKGEKADFLNKRVILSYDNRNLYWQIIDFGHESSGDTCDLMSYNNFETRRVNGSDLTYFSATELYRWLQNTCYVKFPANIRSYLKQINTKQLYARELEATPATLSGYVLIPSVVEMGIASSQEGQLYPAFTTDSNRRRSYEYWTRTPTNQYALNTIRSSGAASTGVYNSSAAVMPIIRFGL